MRIHPRTPEPTALYIAVDKKSNRYALFDRTDIFLQNGQPTKLREFEGFMIALRTSVALRCDFYYHVLL